MHKHQNIHAQSHKPYMHKHELLILAMMVDKSLQSIPRSTSSLNLRVVNSPDYFYVRVTVCACVRVRAFVCTRLCVFFSSSVLCFVFVLACVCRLPWNKKQSGGFRVHGSHRLAGYGKTCTARIFYSTVIQTHWVSSFFLFFFPPLLRKHAQKVNTQNIMKALII